MKIDATHTLSLERIGARGHNHMLAQAGTGIGIGIGKGSVDPLPASGAPRVVFRDVHISYQREFSMFTRTTTVSTAALTLAMLGSTAPACATGADITISSIPQITLWGTVDGVSAYSVGSGFCNLGDSELIWVAFTNQHPIVTSNLYRLDLGATPARFEMIGMSWIHHGLCALQQSACGTCQPAGGGCNDALGIGCSDTTSASAAGQQIYQSPRSQVDPADAGFAFPFSASTPEPVIGRRLQVRSDDLDPSLHPDALYFVETMVLHPEDTAAGNTANNATYRSVQVGAPGASGWNLSFAGSVVSGVPALAAWAALDPEVELTPIAIDGDGELLLAARVVPLEGGAWSYEYALLNRTSDRGVGSFALTLAGAAAISELGFHDVPHHSGEPYSTEDWASMTTPSSVTWETAAFAEDPNANALRWGSLYNFRFVADAPPTRGTATLGLFAPGEAADPVVSVPVPGAAPCAIADLDCNGMVDGADLGVLLGAWGSGVSPADLNGDGVVDGADLGVMLGAWG